MLICIFFFSLLVRPKKKKSQIKKKGERNDAKREEKTSHSRIEYIRNETTPVPHTHTHTHSLHEIFSFRLWRCVLAQCVPKQQRRWKKKLAFRLNAFFFSTPYEWRRRGKKSHSHNELHCQFASSCSVKMSLSSLRHVFFSSLACEHTIEISWITRGTDTMPPIGIVRRWFLCKDFNPFFILKSSISLYLSFINRSKRSSSSHSLSNLKCLTFFFDLQWQIIASLPFALTTHSIDICVQRKELNRLLLLACVPFGSKTILFWFVNEVFADFHRKKSSWVLFSFDFSNTHCLQHSAKLIFWPFISLSPPRLPLCVCFTMAMSSSSCKLVCFLAETSTFTLALERKKRTFSPFANVADERQFAKNTMMKKKMCCVYTWFSGRLSLQRKIKWRRKITGKFKYLLLFVRVFFFLPFVRFTFSSSFSRNAKKMFDLM